MFKKITVLLLVALLMMNLAACGAKKSLDDKIAEKVTEGVINKATGGEGKVDIDMDSGGISFEGEDGEKITLGDTKWPTGEAATKIPELKKGKIISAMSSEKACMAMLEGLDLQDYKQYIEEVKDSGFVNDAVEQESAASYIYYANSDEAALVYLMYDAEGKTLTVSVEISEE